METFTEILAVGGKANSLGRSKEVIERVLEDKTLLGKLYDCLFDDDAWIRMRAVDALEKVCREHPDWLVPYIDRMITELHASTQPSIQWHLAQMYQQVDLTSAQKTAVLTWLKQLLSSTEVDWIASANAMDALVQFAQKGLISKSECLSLLKVQQDHKSKSVVKRSLKLQQELSKE